MRIIAAMLLAALMCGCVPHEKSDEYSETRFIMDTVCTVRAGGTNPRAAVSAAFDKIEEIDAEVNYFSESSDVSAINRAEAGEPVFVGEHTMAILETAQAVSKASGGAFDVTTAPLKDLWNISGGAHEPPSQAEIDALLPHIGYQKLTIDYAARTVTKSDGSVKIDLGGAAKGYAADAAAEILRQNGADYAVSDLGGNIFVVGKNPSRSDGHWLVGIQKPFAQNGEYSKTVSVTEGAVVTSGSYQRYFKWNGVLCHHILNPKNGMPSDSGISSASIIAKSALLADCLSTACMVLGEAEAAKLAEDFGAELFTE